MMEVKKNEAVTMSQMQLEEAKANLKSKALEQEAAIKKDLMEHEFRLNMQLKQMENQTVNGKDKMKEDRKDERTRIQASQQSELIDQRNNGKPPKKFESAGNDNLGGISI